MKNKIKRKRDRALELAESAVIETNTLETETSSEEAIRRAGPLPKR